MSDLSPAFVQRAHDLHNDPDQEPGAESSGAEQEAEDDQQSPDEDLSDTEDENPYTNNASGQNNRDGSTCDVERGNSEPHDIETDHSSASVVNQQAITTPSASCRHGDTTNCPTECSNLSPANGKQQPPDSSFREGLFSPPSSFSRRSARAKPSKLVYDQKYHPLDDLIRPSHAAKRRSIQGEEHASEDEVDVSSFDESDTDANSDAEKISSEDEAKPSKKGRKRVRFEAKSPEPTRRSSRQGPQPRVSYNARVHPQDDLLKLAFAADEAANLPTANKGKRRASESCEDDDELDTRSSKDSRCTTIHSDDTIPESPDPFRSSSPSSPIESLASDDYSPLIWTQPPSSQHIPHNRGSLPEAKGEHFELWVDSFKDQLAHEASQASPLNFDHDDKENDVSNPNLEPEPDVNSGVSVMPLFSYEASLQNRRETPIAHEALYSHDRVVSLPYGLGVIYNGAQYHTDYMRVLASSEHLPRDNPEE